MEYFRERDEYGCSFSKLNRTGLCRTVTTDGVARNYVQHKWWIFKTWVPVDDIIIRSERIFDCGNGPDE